jgi:hypothetical protein
MPLTARGTHLKGVVWFDDDSAAPTSADFPGTTQTLANNLRTALINLGLAAA